MNIGITGGTGFLGSALVKRLGNNKDVTVTLFDKKKESLVSTHSLKRFVSDKQIIIHLAGTTESSLNCYNTNTIGTLHLLEAIKRYGEPDVHVIYASSFAVYEEQATHEKLDEENTKLAPRNHYGMSKLFGEELMRYFNRTEYKKTSILRIANLYGPGKMKHPGIVSRIIERMQKGELVSLDGDGTQTRDFIYIDDAAAAFEKILQSRRESCILNICTGVETSLIGLINALEVIMRKPAKIAYKRGVLERGYWIGNPKRANKEIGFLAETDLNVGLKKTVAGYQKKI